VTVAALSSHAIPIADERASLALVEGRRETYVQCTAETAECTCPDFCERDHDHD
jgi:hypothetical protein